MRAPGFQVMWAFMAFVLMAADGGGNRGLGALGMAESFVNMPEEPKAEEHHARSCGKFDAYMLYCGETSAWPRTCAKFNPEFGPTQTDARLRCASFGWHVLQCKSYPHG